MRRWDFGLISSERSLETVGTSVRLHIIGRSKVFDLFPRTDKGKNRCVFLKKCALTNSRERTRIRLHTRHQDEAVEPRRECCIDVKGKIGQCTFVLIFLIKRAFISIRPEQQTRYPGRSASHLFTDHVKIHIRTAFDDQFIVYMPNDKTLGWSGLPLVR